MLPASVGWHKGLQVQHHNGKNIFATTLSISHEGTKNQQEAAAC